MEESEEEFYKTKYSKTIDNKTLYSINRKETKRNTIMNIKKYNKTIQDKIDKLNLYYNNKQKSSNKIYNLKQDLSKNNNIHNTTRKKTVKKISSNQIENLYNEINRIKNNLKKYQKKNENGLNYLYSVFSKNDDKKFKMSFDENNILINMDKKLMHTVNSFND